MIEATLIVREQVEHAITGAATLGSAYPNTEVGRAAPLVRNGEDAEALGRCNFLDPTIPIEFNLLAHDPIRKALERNDLHHALRPQILTSGALLNRATLGYVPSELFLAAGEPERAVLNRFGEGAAAMGTRMAGGATVAKWTAAKQDGAYRQFLVEVLRAARGLGIKLVAPPTMAATPDIQTSPLEQLRTTVAAVDLLTQPGGSAGEPGGADSVGVLYPLPLTPAAFDDRDFIQKVLAQTRRGLEVMRGRVWGVHLHPHDVSAITRDHQRIPMARDAIRELSSMVHKEFGLFTWVSDFGPVAPAILDDGAAFASYHTGGTQRRIYGGGGPSDPDIQCGKVLGLWEYNLFTRAQLRKRGDVLDETGLFPHAVPAGVDATPKKYRVEWARPRNVSVLERINQEREKELRKGTGRPGSVFIGRSADDDIAPWASQ